VQQSDSCSSVPGVPSFSRSSTLNGVRAADDFVIPAGKQWHLAEVTVSGQLTIPVDYTLSVSVVIYGKGDVQCQETQVVKPVPNSFGSNNVDLTIPFSHECLLYGGNYNATGYCEEDTTYWLSVTPIVSVKNDQSHFEWGFSSTVNGKKYHWRDRDNLFKRDKCSVHTFSDDCGISDVHLAGSVLRRQDLCFNIKGAEEALTDPNVPKSFARATRAGAVTRPNVGPHISWGSATTAATQADIEQTSIVITQIYSTPGWAVALVVLAAVAVVALLVIVAIVIIRRRSPQQERF